MWFQQDHIAIKKSGIVEIYDPNKIRVIETDACMGNKNRLALY